MRLTDATAVFLLVVASPAMAQRDEELREQPRGTLALSAWAKADDPSECTGPGAAQRDDGSFESGYRIPFASDLRFVQLLTPPFYPARLERVCHAFSTSDGLLSMNTNAVVYDDNGPSGLPGSFLGSKPGVAISIEPFVDEMLPVVCSDLNVVVESGGIYVGVQWNAASDFKFFLGSDTSIGTSLSAMYFSASAGNIWSTVTSEFPAARALALRAMFTDASPPPAPEPPNVPPLTSSQYPGFRFWVEIADARIGTHGPSCLPETVCVAGAIPTRAEVFLRIVGPKPNGRLWPNIIKFNTTKTEVWIEQISTGIVKYYLLPNLGPDSETLPGIVDKDGFVP
jgi:hypothetical protein